MSKLLGLMMVATSLYLPVQAEAKSSANIETLINQKSWIHGSADCSTNQDPAIDVLKIDESTYILRQNKCLHYEAPFIYLLMGQHTAFLQDTGATAESDKFPLYDTVKGLMTQWQKAQNIKQLKLLVTHSHGHSDHRAADKQFIGKPNVTLIEPNLEAVRKYFGFDSWPQGAKTLDLGGRQLEIMPLPGHKEDAVAVHDPQTNVMLTGDTFYPGRLYVKNADMFKASMKRLLAFAQQHQVQMFLGTHIEMMAQSGKDYPMGSQYQPNESSLVLTLSDLVSLNKALASQQGELKQQTLDKVIIYPLKP